MTKDVPYYDFPIDIDGSGKSLRALLKIARRDSPGDTRRGDNYPVIKRQMDRFAERFGKQVALDAGSIAVAYLDHLIRNGVIDDPFADGTYQ